MIEQRHRARRASDNPVCPTIATTRRRSDKLLALAYWLLCAGLVCGAAWEIFG